MKPNKALKRLAKIEASVSDLAKRFRPSAPGVRELLQDAKAAVIRAKETVLQVSAGIAKKKAAAPKTGRTTKVNSLALTKSTGKNKRMRVKKTAKKAAAKRAAAALLMAAAKPAAQEQTLTLGGV